MDIKQLRSWLFPTGLFLAILAIAVFLRARQLGATDFWHDEALTGLTIRLPWKEMLAVTTQEKVHPPLFYSLVKIWTMMLGSTSVVAIRSFSLVFGVASVPLVYVIAQQLSLKEKAKQLLGLVIMFVFAVSPFFVAYSVEARSYSLLLFLELLSLFFFVRAMNTPYTFTWNALLCVLLVFVICNTHFLSILIATGYVCAYLLLLLEDKQWLYGAKVQLYSGIGLFIAWISGTWVWNTCDLRRFIKTNNLSWIPQSDLSQIPHTLYALLFGVDRQANGLSPLNGFSFPLYPMSVAMVLFVVAVVVVVLALQKVSKTKEQLRDSLLLLSVGLIPLVVDLLGSSLQLNIYVERYVIGAGAFLLFFVVYVLWQLAESSMVYVLGGYVVMLCMLVYPTPMVRYTTAIQDIPNIQAQKEIVIGSPLDFLPFKYYLPDIPLQVLQDPSGNHYYWPHIPPEVEVPKAQVMSQGIVLVHKSDGQSIPDSWQKIGESKEFVIWRRQ